MFAKQAIFFLSGKDYANAILPMQILMPTLLMIGITNILGIQMLVPLGKEKVVLYSEIAGAIIDLLLNAVLIPRLLRQELPSGLCLLKQWFCGTVYFSERNGYKSLKENKLPKDYGSSDFSNYCFRLGELDELGKFCLFSGKCSTLLGSVWRSITHYKREICE